MPLHLDVFLGVLLGLVAGASFQVLFSAAFSWIWALTSSAHQAIQAVSATLVASIAVSFLLLALTLPVSLFVSHWQRFLFPRTISFGIAALAFGIRSRRRAA